MFRMYKYGLLTLFVTFRGCRKNVSQDKMNRLALLVLCVAAADAYYRRSGNTPELLAADGLGLQVPKYTTLLDHIDKASARVKSFLGPNHLDGQYVVLTNAINQLINGGSNEAAYYEFYDDNINKAILQALSNPQKTGDSIRKQIDKTLSGIAAIRETINLKQDTVCVKKISYECDLIIDLAVRTSTNELLKKEAHFIQTVGAEVDAFLDNYAQELESVAKSNNAEPYLVNSRDHLYPLTKLGAATRQEFSALFPSLSRRYDSVKIELDDY